MENSMPISTNIFEKAVCLSITLEKFGSHRSVKWSEAERADMDTTSDKKMVHISKDILDCAELKAISKHYARIKQYID